mgnify:CR=1 FL=1
MTSKSSFRLLFDDRTVYTGTNSPVPVVDMPSPEILGVFVVDEEGINRNFAQAPTRGSPEQLLCEGHDYNEVTKGLYLTKDELADGKLRQEIVYVLGLESACGR